MLVKLVSIFLPFKSPRRKNPMAQSNLEFTESNTPFLREHRHQHRQAQRDPQQIAHGKHKGIGQRLRDQSRGARTLGVSRGQHVVPARTGNHHRYLLFEL